MNESMKEALKEGGRVIVLALLSYLLTEGVISTLVQYFIGTRLDTVLVLQLVGAITTVLRSVDKYLHERGVVTENAALTRGITQF